MKKWELSDELASRLGSVTVATAALDAIIEVVMQELAQGGAVTIEDFGTFRVEQRSRVRAPANPRSAAVPVFQATGRFADLVGQSIRERTVAHGRSPSRTAEGPKAKTYKRSAKSGTYVPEKAVTAKKGAGKKTTKKAIPSPPANPTRTTRSPGPSATKKRSGRS